MSCGELQTALKPNVCRASLGAEGRRTAVSPADEQRLHRQIVPERTLLALLCTQSVLSFGKEVLAQ